MANPMNPASCPAAPPPAMTACTPAAQGTGGGMGELGDGACRYTSGMTSSLCFCNSMTSTYQCIMRNQDQNQTNCPRNGAAPANGATCMGTSACLTAASTCTCTNGAFVCVAMENCPASRPANMSSCLGLGGLTCPYAAAQGSGGAAAAGGAANAAGAPAQGSGGGFQRAPGCRCSGRSETWNCQ